MAWFDRLKEAAYTSPSGNRYIFKFENVSTNRTKRTTNFEFPDAVGTYVQENGVSGRVYPMQCIFWGPNCDLDAEAFDNALVEVGTGKLEHPLYGTFDVVPTGTITRRDDLKTAANQVILDVSFMSTIGIIYPSSQTDPASEVIAGIDNYNNATAESLGDNLELGTAVERSTFKNQYDALLDQVEGGLQTIAAAKDSVEAEFNAINDSINRGIDVLIAQPTTLAFQTLQLIQAPARALSLISDRLSAYGNLIDTVILGNKPTSKNEYYTKDLYASTYVTGSVLSTVNNTFDTKVAAVEAANDIITQFEEVNTWRDENLTDLEIIDTGEAYQQLQEVVALTAGYLVEISFSLKQERRIVLDKNRTIIDLAAELYGSVDDNLDFLINSNDLSGSEILELPKGKEVVYYV
jgi:prophage DNA circulation protein